MFYLNTDLARYDIKISSVIIQFSGDSNCLFRLGINFALCIPTR
jgi:hypothetical protein